MRDLFEKLQKIVNEDNDFKVAGDDVDAEIGGVDPEISAEAEKEGEPVEVEAEEKDVLAEEPKEEGESLEEPAEGAEDAKGGFEVTDALIEELKTELPDLATFDVEQVKLGLEDEKEHIDVTNGDPLITAKITLAHLKELPDYYTRLKAMVDAAQAEGAEKEEPIETPEGAVEPEVIEPVKADEGKIPNNPNEYEPGQIQDLLEKGKKCKEDEVAQAKKDNNKKQEDEINKKAVKK